MATRDVTAQPATATEALTGYRRVAELAYGYLLVTFVVGVLVQIYLAGVGAFGRHQAGAFDPHENLGHALGIGAGVVLVLALVAHQSLRTMIWAFVLALLTEVAQEGLASGGRSDKWVGGLHAFAAALILALSVWLLLAWRRRRKAVATGE
jgi:Family of unknown function (DUF6220)